MFIDGFGLSGYRSFGEELQLFGPCSKINIIIGQNNSGKSNVLRFLVDFLGMFHDGKGPEYKDLDRHLGKNLRPAQIAVGMRLDGEHFNELIKRHGLQDREKLNAFSHLKRMLSFDELTLGTGVPWFIYENASGLWDPSMSTVEEIARKRLVADQPSVEGFERWTWSQIFSAMQIGAQVYDSRTLQEVLPKLLGALSPRYKKLPNITLIRAIREVKSDESQEEFDYSGINIVRELAKLERPDVGAGPEYAESKNRFEMINRFVVEVTGTESMRLEVPASMKTIQVREGERALPLAHLGTGIHEVIILAIAATLLENQIICIEEPEIHLHPILQKKLLRYLSENTTNQYFITTHSAAMIDLPGAAIFHIKHDGEQSKVKRATTLSDRFEVASDLGYRASDLLQTNCIIWVEGPTDRIYLRHWIDNVAPELTEGIQYSMMFYGGRLLSHLSADDEEVTDFIALRRINQNLAIVIDSDKKYSRAPINETKRRVREEFDNGPGFAWVTKGREIENYVPEQLMLEALREIYPSQKIDRLRSVDTYDYRYHYVLGSGEEVLKDIDKVKIARAVASRAAVLDELDLRAMINKVVRFIRDCNDFPAS